MFHLQSLKRPIAGFALALLPCTAWAQGSDCGSAVAIIGTGNFPYSTLGETASGTAASSTVCASLPNVDTWFVWNSILGGVYTFEIENGDPNYLLAMSVWASCSGPVVRCDIGNSFFNGDLSFSLNVPASTTYYLQITAQLGQVGSGILEIGGPSSTIIDGDNCNLEPVINGVETVAFNTVGASPSFATPVASCVDRPDVRDIWYRWNVGTPGDYTLSACGTFDIALAVRTACEGGSVLACSNDGNCLSDLDAELTFNASASTTYWIQISGRNLEIGTGILQIEGPPGSLVPNDDCVDATPIAGLGLWEYSTVGSLPEGGTSCGSGTNNDVWFRWTSGPAGTYTFSNCGATYDTVLELRAGSCVFPLPVACSESGDCGTSSVVEDTRIVWNMVEANTEYLIQIGGWDTATGTGLLAIDGPGVTNDSCETAGLPFTGEGSFGFSTVFASDSGIPTGCGSGPSFDVWYGWIPTQSGDYMLRICDADYDADLAVYSGCGGVNLGCDCNGDCGISFNDAELFLPNLIAGFEYRIQVSGFGSAVGTGTVSIEGVGPPNDDCAGATPIAGHGTFPFETIFATTDGPANPLCDKDGDPEIYDDVWFRWTAPATETVRVMTCGGTELDTEIAVYQGGSCLGPILACGDQECFDQSVVGFDATAGSQYLIRIGSFFAGGEGTGHFFIESVGPGSDIGQPYCIAGANSVSPTGAKIQASGSTSLLVDDLNLGAIDLPPGTPGIFYYGELQVSVPFGEGFRCVGGATYRLPPVFATPAGTSSFSPSVNVLPGSVTFLPGLAWNFQYWYRDPAGGPSGFNLSDARRILFIP